MAHPTAAVVLTGAAARGAFQAGALATLLPALHRSGIKPSIYLGTSAGAINAALLGSFAHLDPDAAVAELLGVWRAMDRPQVLTHPLVSSVANGVRVLPGLLAGVGPGLPSLLGVAPLRRSAHEVLDAARLTANVHDPAVPVTAVGVVATRMPAPTDPIAGARCTVFVDSADPVDPVADPARGVDVAPTPIGADHVLASAAIPAAFPAVHVAQPDDSAGWYVDGGIRLNAPLRPAVALGATHVVAIAAGSTDYPVPPAPVPADSPWPDVADAAAVTLHAVLGDRMIDDLHELGRRNAWADAGLTAPDGRPYRRIEVTTVAPAPGELSDIAAEVVREKRDSWWRNVIGDSDTLSLARLLRAVGEGSGPRELLSYVLFDQEYFAAQIEAGQRAGLAAAASLPGAG